MKKNKAFTLIELLIVVGIIAVLSAITFVFLGNARSAGTDAGKIEAMSETQKALQLYATDNDGFPSSLSQLVNGNYIGSIDKNIIYAGVDSSGGVCTISPCPSYHLAVPLQSADNKVLSSDAEKTTGGIDGTKDNCTSTGTASTPDLCYDIAP